MVKSGEIDQAGGSVEVVINDGIDYRAYELGLLLQGHQAGHLCGSNVRARGPRYTETLSNARHRLRELILGLYGVDTGFHVASSGLPWTVWMGPKCARVRFVTLESHAMESGIDMNAAPLQALLKDVKSAWSTLESGLENIYVYAFRMSADCDIAEEFALHALRGMTFQDACSELEEACEDASVTSHCILQLAGIYNPIQAAAIRYENARSVLNAYLKQATEAA